MRGCTVRVVAFYCVVLLAAVRSRAAGPQFTGLLNFYDPARSDFSEQRNSLARMDPDGPIGAATALRDNWADIVVAPDGSGYYAIIQGNQSIYRIDPDTLAKTKMLIAGPGI